MSEFLDYDGLTYYHGKVKTEFAGANLLTSLKKVSGPIVSIPDGMEKLPFKKVLVNIDPVQSGSGDPSPTNIRAISGRTACNVTRCGVSVLKPTLETWYEGNSKESNGVTFTWAQDHHGIVHANGTAGESHSSLNYSLIWLPRGQYKISGLPDPTSYTGQQSKPICLRIGPNSIGGSPQQFLGNGDTFTVDSYSRWGFRLYVFNGATVDADFRPMLIPIELYEEGMEFEPYSEDTYSFSFPNPPETVYGGYLDVTTGVLTVNGRLLTLQTGGTGTYAYNSTNGQLRITGFNSIINDVRNVCSHYKSFRGPFANLPDKSIMASGGTIAIKDSSLTSLEAWMAFLDGQVTAETPVMVAIQYTVTDATTTYQLTPQEVLMLLGENNVWADTGDTEVTYGAYLTLLQEQINALANP